MREGRLGVRTGSLESLRELNRLRVVETLRERGTASRAEIARVTGLSRSTVSSLVADLQAQRPRRRVLRPRRAGQHGHRPPADAARRSTPRPAPPSASTSATTRSASRSRTCSRTVLAEAIRAEDVDHDAEGALDTAAELVDELLAEAGARPRPTCIGVGMALSGPIDHDRGARAPDGDPARLGGARGGGRDRASASATCPSTSTTTPTWARSPR